MTEINKINNIEPVLEDMKNICISKAIRTRHGRSPGSFNKNWEEHMIKEFDIYKDDKERWGSFYNGALIAFMSVFQVDGTMFISYAASHSDHLDKCPNDALIFSILEQYKNVSDCDRVSFGDWSNVHTLNKFKSKYGFEKVDLPVYARNNPLVYWAKKLNHFWQSK